MKRIISCLSIAAVLLLSGCSNYTPKLDPNKFYVEVDVKCEGVYILEGEYSLDGKPMGGRSTQNGNFEKDILKDNTLYFGFSAEDFPASDNAENGLFGISFEVADRDGTRHTVIPAEEYNGAYYAANVNSDAINEWSWNARFGGEYKFAIESSQGGYSIYPTN